MATRRAQSTKSTKPANETTIETPVPALGNPGAGSAETTDTEIVTVDAQSAAVEEQLALVPTDEGGAVVSLPDADSPIETPNIRSYKTPGGLNPSKVQPGSPCLLVYSDDGGMTNRQAETNYVIGRPVDLVLQFIESDLDDVPVNARFHLGMTDSEGVVCEFNLNCLASSRNGEELYVPGPARTLIGALNEISMSAEDSTSFFDACKIELNYGKRSKFFNIGLAYNGKWVNASRDSYRMGPANAEELVSIVKQIKVRFQGMQLVKSGAAVYGENVLHDAIYGGQTTLDTETEDVPF